MKVKEITASAGRTFNHPFESYSNLRVDVRIKAEIEEGEDPDAATKTLLARVEREIEAHKQAKLNSLRDPLIDEQDEEDEDLDDEEEEREREALEALEDEADIKADELAMAENEPLVPYDQVRERLGFPDRTF